MQSSSVSVLDEMNRIASIKMMTWKVVTGLFFGLAIVSVIGRATIRFRNHPKPTLDDCLIFFGCACLIAATGLSYRNFDNMYATQAIWDNPQFMFTTGQKEMYTALREFNIFNKISLSLLWTTTFSVKLSFLVFFRQLIESVENIRWYHKFVVGFTIVSWMFVLSEMHILCPYVGVKSIECASNFSGKLYFSLTGLVTALDVFTDILLVSIPIIVLNRTNIRIQQKAAVGVFLCLSLVMAVLALCRVSKMHGHVAIDIPYELFWQYLEAAVAILMASLTAYRTFFVRHKERQRYKERMQRPSYSFRYFGRKKGGVADDTERQLPSVPRATLTGLRTFIRRNNDSNAQISMASQDPLSTTDTYASDKESFITKPDGIMLSSTKSSSLGD